MNLLRYKKVELRLWQLLSLVFAVALLTGAAATLGGSRLFIEDDGTAGSKVNVRVNGNTIVDVTRLPSGDADFTLQPGGAGGTLSIDSGGGTLIIDGATITGAGPIAGTTGTFDDLIVNTSVSFPADSISDTMVSDILTASDLVAGASVVSDSEVDNDLTIDGGSINNSPINNSTIGAGGAAAGTFTNVAAGFLRLNQPANALASTNGTLILDTPSGTQIQLRVNTAPILNVANTGVTVTTGLAVLGGSASIPGDVVIHDNQAGAFVGHVRIAPLVTLGADRFYDLPNLSGEFTLQGNTFNGVSQLVQLNGSAELPALSGVNLTNLTAGNLSGVVATANGGLGIDASSGGSGEFLIANGSGGFSFGALTDTLVPDNITIAAAGSVDAGAIDAGTLADARLSSNVFLADGTVTMTGTLDLGANTLTTTNASHVANLNADLLDGLHANAFGRLASVNTFTNVNTFNGTVNANATLGANMRFVLNPQIVNAINTPVVAPFISIADNGAAFTFNVTLTAQPGQILVVHNGDNDTFTGSLAGVTVPSGATRMFIFDASAPTFRPLSP